MGEKSFIQFDLDFLNLGITFLCEINIMYQVYGQGEVQRCCLEYVKYQLDVI